MQAKQLIRSVWEILARANALQRPFDPDFQALRPQSLRDIIITGQRLRKDNCVVTKFKRTDLKAEQALRASAVGAESHPSFRA